MMGDDLYCKADMDKCIALSESSVLIKKIRSKFSGGQMDFDKDGNLKAIIEGNHKSGYINAALYVIGKEYFNYAPVAIKDGKEYGLPQTLVKMAQDHDVKVVESLWWHQVTDVEDVKRASSLLKNRP